MKLEMGLAITVEPTDVQKEKWKKDKIWGNIIGQFRREGAVKCGLEKQKEKTEKNFWLRNLEKRILKKDLFLVLQLRIPWPLRFGGS